MLQALALLMKLRKYWPLIRLVLALMSRNEGLLRDLVARPQTGPAEDLRDFTREIDRRGAWQDDAFNPED